MATEIHGMHLRDITKEQHDHVQLLLREVGSYSAALYLRRLRAGRDRQAEGRALRLQLSTYGGGHGRSRRP